MANQSIPTNTAFFVPLDLELVTNGPGEYCWRATLTHSVYFDDAGQCDGQWLPAGAVIFIPTGQLKGQVKHALDQVAEYYKAEDALPEQPVGFLHPEDFFK